MRPKIYIKQYFPGFILKNVSSTIRLFDYVKWNRYHQCERVLWIITIYIVLSIFYLKCVIESTLLLISEVAYLIKKIK